MEPVNTTDEYIIVPTKTAFGISNKRVKNLNYIPLTTDVSTIPLTTTDNTSRLDAFEQLEAKRREQDDKNLASMKNGTNYGERGGRKSRRSKRINKSRRSRRSRKNKRSRRFRR